MVTVTCSVCGALFDSEHSPAIPFCSIRCRQVDLNRWFNEEYSMPVESEEEGFEPEMS